ncbi:MAG: polymerase, sigma 70 subunit, RpoD subfamily [Patescibacteria group bacterium]|nr:polymerase, sigma 70 subunit, RpoD subfamily [Patescibacteria group bacterium]
MAKNHSGSVAHRRAVLQEYLANPTSYTAGEVLKANSGLVKQEVERRQAISEGALSVEDLSQEGFIGMWKALEQFEPERGFQFSTYAVYKIKQRIGRYLETNHSYFSSTSHAGAKVNSMVKAYKDFLIRHGYEPSEKELAVTLNWTPEQFNAAYTLFQLRQNVYSTNECIGEEGESDTFLESLKDESALDLDLLVEQQDLADQIIRVMRLVLKPQEFDVLLRRSQGETFSGIGRHKGVSRQAIEQTYKAAVKKVRKHFEGVSSVK